jgi:hypothetical protein
MGNEFTVIRVPKGCLNQKPDELKPEKQQTIEKKDNDLYQFVLSKLSSVFWSDVTKSEFSINIATIVSNTLSACTDSVHSCHRELVKYLDSQSFLFDTYLIQITTDNSKNTDGFALTIFTHTKLGHTYSVNLEFKLNSGLTI